MKTNKTFKLILALTLIIFLPDLALARGGTGREWMYSLSSAAGISNPSMYSAVFENPAAIGFHSRLAITGATFSANDSYNDPGFGGTVHLGTGMVGASAGINHLTVGSGSTSAHYGLGFYFKGAKVALGGAGVTQIDPGSGSDFNVGMLINPEGKLQIGVVALGVDDTIEWGGGVGFTLSRIFQMNVDVTTDENFGTFNIKPALTFGSMWVRATVGYSFNSDGNTVSSSIMNDGFSAGAAFMVGRNVVLNLYFEQINTLYGSLTFRL